ncbi:MAG: cobyric acid synthase [bacterium]|nr:cobyric acid synthase [bacterium]
MAKVIMVQGTMSNAGKSLLVAGLCRIFHQDGYRVAPFKSQNMALNSYITEEGLEMGRAQAVQAEAAGVKPEVAMNPILLKPTTDVGSQVIVRGVPIGNMKARDYFAFKKQLIPEILSAYETLSRKYDIIVIEGAGSPAEINLKKDDIVNMGLAELVNAPVLLAGDIDRGGVFAQLYGTVMLLEEKEKARIRGLIINKFRGDKTILDPGIRMIEELCDIPVVGVVPYMQVDIEDEDSLSRHLDRKQRGKAPVQIAAVRFPRISNFTDFQVFDMIPEAEVYYASSVEELGRPDLILLPGTKNTVQDLLWMRQNGMEAAILKAHAAGTAVFGICGGYQMLGYEVSDVLGIEGEPQTVRGMGLLPVKTVLETEKTRTLADGVLGNLDGDFKNLSKKLVTGYEIHMGHTTYLETEACALGTITARQGEQEEEKADGCFFDNVYGTYLHGFFDAPQIAECAVSALLEKKGLDAVGIKEYSYSKYKEMQFDRLADGLRESLDMEKLYEILGMRA